MNIIKADMNRLNTVSSLAHQLWPNHALSDLMIEMKHLLSSSDNALFIAQSTDEIPLGFAHGSIRVDYVEGTCSSPVGYLEGIYVCPKYRHHGIAAHLLKACEKWAISMGCIEFASDCSIENTASYTFHLSHGFTEANRIICFTKKID